MDTNQKPTSEAMTATHNRNAEAQRAWQAMTPDEREAVKRKHIAEQAARVGLDPWTYEFCGSKGHHGTSMKGGVK